MQQTTDYEIEPAIYQRRWAILAVLCTSLLIVIIGNTSLNVALPTLARDLDASTSSLQWMVDAYSLVFAGLLFTAGTIGDRFGRKGALQAGLLLFLVGAAVASVAATAAMVIAARAVMEHSKHVLLAGPGAELFARQHGLASISMKYFSATGKKKNAIAISR